MKSHARRVAGRQFSSAVIAPATPSNVQPFVGTRRRALEDIERAFSGATGSDVRLLAAACDSFSGLSRHRHVLELHGLVDAKLQDQGG